MRSSHGGNTVNIETTTVQKLIISGVENLDPVAVYLEDQGPACGKVTITCFNDCWSYFWGSMGKDNTIRSFLLQCDEHYLAGKFAPLLDSEVDVLDDIVSHCRKEICKERRQGNCPKKEAREMWEQAEELDGVEDSRELFDNHGMFMHDLFGDEWWYCLPKAPNHKYEYLCRIINTVKEALRQAS